MNSLKTRKKELSLWGRQMDAQELESWISLAKTAISQPVISGSIAYFGVSAIEGAIVSYQNSGKKPTPNVSLQQALTNFLTVFVTDVNAVANLDVATATNDIFAFIGKVDIQALKLAIILYVASGGNLVGLLQSSGGAFGGMLQKLLPVAAVAP